MAQQTTTVPSGGAPMPRGAPNIAPIPISAVSAYPGTTSQGGYLKPYGTEAATDTLCGQSTKAAPDAMPGGTGRNPTYPTPPGDGTNIPVGLSELSEGQQQFHPVGEVAVVGPVGGTPQPGGESPPPPPPEPEEDDDDDGEPQAARSKRRR